MPREKQPSDNQETEEKENLEVQFTLDTESQETAKKLEKRIFDRLISRDLDLIKKHKLKNHKNKA